MRIDEYFQMGSLDQYHILLNVTKQQEVAIKKLFNKHKWHFLCQGKTNLNEYEYRNNIYFHCSPD